MSEVEGTEELNDENTVKAPAEELVELILTGELHAANQKFNSIIEDKVVESIEEEIKISEKCIEKVTEFKYLGMWLPHQVKFTNDGK